MRVSIFVSVALVGVVLLAEGTSSGDCVNFAKPRTKPNREIRGFQPETFSTAIGFGKREFAKQDKYEKIMLLLRNSPQSIPLMWLLQEMKKNPELAKRIARGIDDTSDEESPGSLSTAELFKSERRISFF